MAEPFEFTLPVSGKKIKWKPLNVKQQLDLAAVHSGQQQVYLNSALLAARICAYPGVDGRESASCNLAQIGEWDDVDYNLFSEEVEEKETARRAMFGKKESASTLSMKLQKAVMDSRESILLAMKAMDACVEAAKAAEVAANIPLKQG